MRIQTLFILLFAIWLLYLISPFDLFPEALAGPFGLLDDLLLLLALYWRYSEKIRRYKEQLRFYRERLQRGGDTSDSGQHSVKQDPHEVLEINKSASAEEIERSYKKLIALYHPDKVAHLGKELQELAHKKSLQIQEAYHALGKDK